MKYIKTYESFKTNEEVSDFMFFPQDVDITKGYAQMWSDLLDGLYEFIEKFYKGTKELFTKGVEKFCELIFKVIGDPNEILDKITKYFGTPASDLTWKQVYDGIMNKNPELVKESREEEMEEHMEKDSFQKAGSVLQGIFGINAFGGILVGLSQWISESFANFDLLGWANSLGLPDAMSNIGNRGFIPAWFIVSLIAIGIIALIKKADAYLSTDKGLAGKIYK